MLPMEVSSGQVGSKGGRGGGEAGVADEDDGSEGHSMDRLLTGAARNPKRDAATPLSTRSAIAVEGTLKTRMARLPLSLARCQGVGSASAFVAAFVRCWCGGGVDGEHLAFRG